MARIAPHQRTVKATNRRTFLLALAFGFFLVHFTGAALGQSTERGEGSLALAGGTIYVSPTEPPLVDGVAVVRQGKIRCGRTRDNSATASRRAK